MVGVHQITAVTKEAAGAAARLTRVKKVYQPANADQAAENYLGGDGRRSSGHGASARDPGGKNAVSSCLAEPDRPHLATLALDAPAPILTSAANGLNGHAFEGDPLPPATITAHGAAALLATPGDGSG